MDECFNLSVTFVTAGKLKPLTIMSTLVLLHPHPKTGKIHLLYYLQPRQVYCPVSKLTPALAIIPTPTPWKCS